MAAGTLLLTGLVILGALAYLAWYGIFRFIPSVTESRTASISAIVGSLEVRDPGSDRWVVATQGQKISEGQTIRTHENSRALITLFDQSTVNVYSQTQLTFNELRTNRFGRALRSNPRNIVNIAELSGRALFGVAHVNPVADVDFEVTNGNSVARLHEGSFIVKASPSFEVVATRGSSEVSAFGKEVAIHGGERTQVQNGQGPAAPILAAENLIDNGDFAKSDGSGKPLNWDLLAPTPEARDVPGRTQLTTDGSLPVVRFSRTSGTYHAEQGIRQVVNQDVTDYAIVRLDLVFKVMYQNVSGGGDQGSEYPLMVRVNYLDENGAPAFFVRGFYIQNPGNLPVTNGQQVNANEWVNMVGDTGISLQGLSPRPQYIQSIDIVASGHDYQSEIQKVSLVVE